MNKWGLFITTEGLYLLWIVWRLIQNTHIILLLLTKIQLNFKMNSKFVLMNRGALLNATLTKILNAVLSDEEKWREDKPNRLLFCNHQQPFPDFTLIENVAVSENARIVAVPVNRWQKDGCEKIGYKLQPNFLIAGHSFDDGSFEWSSRPNKHYGGNEQPRSSRKEKCMKQSGCKWRV